MRRLAPGGRLLEPRCSRDQPPGAGLSHQPKARGCHRNFLCFPALPESWPQAGQRLRRPPRRAEAQAPGEGEGWCSGLCPEGDRPHPAVTGSCHAGSDGQVHRAAPRGPRGDEVLGGCSCRRGQGLRCWRGTGRGSGGRVLEPGRLKPSRPSCRPAAPRVSGLARSGLFSQRCLR